MSATEESQDLTSVARRYRALLDIAASLASRQELPDLLQDVAARLQQVEKFEFLQVALYDLASAMLRERWVTSEGISSESDVPVQTTATGQVFQTQKPLVISDLQEPERNGTVPNAPKSIRSLAVFPLLTPDECLGTIGFGSTNVVVLDATTHELLAQIAGLVALAADRALVQKREEEYQNKLAVQRGHCHLLLEINKLLFAELDPQALFAAISRSLHSLLRHDFAFLILRDAGTGRFRIHAMDAPPGTGFFKTGLTYAVEWSPSNEVLQNRTSMLLSAEELASHPTEIARKLFDEGIRSACWAPLLVGDRGLGTLCVGSLQTNMFSEDDVELLTHVAGQVAIALDNAFAFGQVSELIDKLEQEKLYLESEVGSSYRPEEIIGDSEALSLVLEQVRTVAPTQASVLIFGETGTGKELIARAIHRLSSRSQKPFVKLNCSAIPTGLLESELFGHEKGAFTGAVQQKTGRLELAHEGTLFLDEVGDIPLELQPKLLRVLQEQEFERLGSNRTLRVNVRLVAATNRNLETMVDSGEFRRDLFYRLNVFPIHVPALRDRKEDIPRLVRHFVTRFATRMNRRVGTIPPNTMNALQDWFWPGNVRELENLIERSVILSPGRTLNVPLAELKSSHTRHPLAAAATLAEAEKAHIERVLRETKGVIGGPDGAAARLGVKRTTLNYRIKKLGIDPRALSQHDKQ